jgi:zinc transport system substrate-binding protein
MAATAREVAAALARLDPAGTTFYDRQLGLTLAQIEAVDAELRRELAAVAGRRFLVYHPSWGTFAARYGLEQVAIEADGKEPSARRLVELVEQARRDGTGVVFVQAGVADRSARVLASEIGAEVVPLDALAEDWPANLRRAGAAMRSALGG